ncbi:hypothetical protein K461DRAFT_278198 [Myriangium duriaei CBS 260.36]|uniref:cysteine--tRNA ligase n=1 Tax=Myriangium duriaei CBS 260.36 TaxID=1168546 RepID=A0A9P4J292_9PEZI|nr:hypothetical protein K461DRAFT_278198 [Myriangium duriaei CBS 260.36]
MAAVMPTWTPPPEPAPAVKERLPKLSIYNTLTRSKTPFVPVDPEGKKVTWYACGPTVYDDSHLGHARNYVSTDILRRILVDYFKYDVKFVMNITDVDDKIILAARQRHFLEQYILEHPQVDNQAIESTSQALQAYILVHLPLLANDLSLSSFPSLLQEKYGHVLVGKSLANDGTPPGDKEAKVKMHIKTAASAAEALADTEVDATLFYHKASGVLRPFLDTKLKTTIDSRDHSVFTTMTKEYEKRFFDDLGALNVRPPDVITRVTEYGPQIVDFVKKIQDNGFAYEHEGSVYYDTKAWESSGGIYARLEPWSKNDKDLQADGEGALSNDKTSFKKSSADFALWKSSRPGEPGWPSPWGEGRPGWHIECSCMASDVLGEQFDIHSGGIDLAFPHHDNELAQSEAYWANGDKERKQWVNYFIHMGHLSIQGAKMSKSLKNFTTIREALQQGLWTPRSLRIAYLLGNWRDGLEITPEVVSTGNAWEDRMTNFFLKASDLKRNPTSHSASNGNASANDSGSVVLKALETAKARVHDALLDSFDTPTALRAMSELVTAFNSEKNVPDPTTFEVASWLTSIINVFGLDASPRDDQVGWSGIDIPEIAKDYVHAASAIRDEVRRQAIKGQITDPIGAAGVDTSLTTKLPASPAAQPYQAVLCAFQTEIETALSNSSPAKVFLQLSDKLRDGTLWNLGIYLEDRENQPALVRPLTASLKEERDNREALAALKLQKQAEVKQKAEREARERLEKGKLDPRQMFRTEEFSAWDEEGLPTKDKEGNDVAKSRSKKLKKDWERQKKLHEEWKVAQGK